MSKILIEGSKVIVDGHANDLETCNTLTNLCDELSTSEKFRTVKYESGYGEFESVSDSEEKKFVPVASVVIYSNDGITRLREISDVLYKVTLKVISTGMTLSSGIIYSYAGDKVFLGFSNTANSTSPTFPIGYTNTVSELLSDDGMSVILYIVEKDLGYQVNIQSNDGATTLAQNATVDSVVVTATGAQLKCGDAVKATYTYSGSKLFAGLATSANATAPKYKPGDTIKITANTTLYIVENIIIPEHHSSLNELFTNIAAVIREKTGDTASIVADDFPDMIRERLGVIPTLISFTIDRTTYQAEKGMTWGEWINSKYASSEQTRQCSTCGATESLGEHKFGFVSTGTGIGWESSKGCERVIKRPYAPRPVASSEEIDTSIDYVTNEACND